MKPDKHINNNSSGAENETLQEMRERHNKQLKHYTMTAFGRLKYTAILLGIIILLQILLKPDNLGHYLLVIAIVTGLDMYLVLRKRQPIDGWRVVRSNANIVFFVLLMSYLWAFFDWMGLFFSIMGYAIISTIMAAILVYRNREEWNKASDMIAGMIRERRNR